MKSRKIIALFLALLMTTLLFAGCGKTSETPDPVTSNAPANTQAPASTAPESGEPDDAISFPVEGGYTFEGWWPLDNNLTTVIRTMAEHPYFVEMEKRTGVSIDFTHPVMGSEGESYNLLVASEDYGDFLVKFGMYHQRGLDDAVENGVVLDMRDYLQYLPNYNSYRTRTREAEIETMTDSGYLAGLACIYEYIHGEPGGINGLSVRQDYLDELGLEAPTTISEIEYVLAAFKENIPACENGPIYFGIFGAGIEPAFNLNGFRQMSFTMRNGEIRPIVIEPEYKQYVQLLADWYKRGLLWQDFMSETMYIANFNCQSNVLNGEFGIFYDCYVNVEPFEINGRQVNPKFDLTPIPYPTLEKGGTNHVGMLKRIASQGMLGITPQCTNVPLACKFWDYGFSEEGILLGNFGTEGVTFTYDDKGVPHYTELIYKNPDPTIGPYFAENIYILQNAPYVFIADRSMDYWGDVEIDCYNKWVENTDSLYTLPSLSFTAEEGIENSNVLNDVNTYMSENFYNFVTGVKPMSEFDAFVEQIKSMGIEKVVKNYEAAYARYNNRGK